MTTIRDVARTAGVSVATASRALNGHLNVTDGVRKRVTDAAAQLNYIPHSGARSLTRQRSDAIGVVLPDLFGEYFSELVRGIDRIAHQAGLQLLLSNMHGSAQGTATAIRAMRGRVDGLLIMPPEIANAFLVPEATMAQRISRAKQAIRSSGIRFTMPDASERDARLTAYNRTARDAREEKN